MKKILLIGLAFFADRIVKYIAFLNKETITNEFVVIPHVFSLKYVENHGISFGLFKNNILLTVIVPILLIIFLYGIFRKINNKHFNLAFMIIVGSFLGNLFDRVFKGYVIDMIFFPFIPFFVCNLSDIMIFVSSLFIAFKLILRDELA